MGKFCTGEIDWGSSVGAFKRPKWAGCVFAYECSASDAKWVARIRCGALATEARRNKRATSSRQWCKCCDLKAVEDESHVLFACVGTGADEWLCDLQEVWKKTGRMMKMVDCPPPCTEWLTANRWALRAALIPFSIAGQLSCWVHDKVASFSRMLHINLVYQSAELMRKRERCREKKPKPITPGPIGEAELLSILDSILAKWARPCHSNTGMNTVQVLELVERCSGTKFSIDESQNIGVEARARLLNTQLSLRLSSVGRGTLLKRWPISTSYKLEGSKWLQQAAWSEVASGSPATTGAQHRMAKLCLRGWFENHPHIVQSYVYTKIDEPLLLWELEHSILYPSKAKSLCERCKTFCNDLKHTVNTGGVELSSWLHIDVKSDVPEDSLCSVSVLPAVPFCIERVAKWS